MADFSMTPFIEIIIGAVLLSIGLFLTALIGWYDSRDIEVRRLLAEDAKRRQNERC